ncbi:MAG: hypothetical protein V2A64_06230 [Candidatus Omnitrophota bacterium]
MKKCLRRKLSFILRIKTRNSFGQSIIDFALAFIAIAVLSVGIARIWIWFSANFARRQVNYQQSRIVAGVPKNYESLGHGKSVDIAAKEDNIVAVYKPLDLTEDWVFKGKPSETIFGKEVDYGIDPRTACREECKNDPACITNTEEHPEGEFMENCVCFVKCMCGKRIDPVFDIWNEQAAQFRLDAQGMRTNADELRKAANKCKWYKPWCWTRGMRQSKRKLKAAARRLDREAAEADEQAANLETKAVALKNCCQLYETSTDQDNCISLIKGTACLELTQPYIEKWNDEILKLEEDKKELQDSINIIGDGLTFGVIFTCNQQAKASCENSCKITCTDRCTTCDAENVCTLDDSCYTSCYDECYPPCYEITRNTCCRETQVEGEGSGRNCDAPLPACSEEETEETEIRCSLALVAEKFRQEIIAINAAIAVLEQKKTDLPGCCKLKSDQEQLACISRLAAEEPKTDNTETTDTYKQEVNDSLNSVIK